MAQRFFYSCVCSCALALAMFSPSAPTADSYAAPAIESSAAEVKISGPKAVVVGSAIFLRVEGLPLDSGYAWQAVPAVDVQEDLVIRGGTPALFAQTQTAGEYTFVLGYIDAGRVVLKTWPVTVKPFGPAPPTPPGPVPPGPTPPPEPQPVSGKRGILIVRETAEANPALARLIVGLRRGPHADYLTSKGHGLFVLDQNLPSPITDTWRPHLSGIKLPALIVFDPEAKRIVSKGELPATAAEVLEIVKKGGG